MTDIDERDAAWIDHAALRRLLKLMGNDTDELAELVADYVSEAPDLARRIGAAAESGDRDAFRIAAHTLKSNARDFGAVRLGTLCASAEATSSLAVDTGDLSELARDIAHTEQAARRSLCNIDLQGLDGQAGTE